jgi:hypothetical protein
MFDKIAIRGAIEYSDIESVVLMNYLEECSEGDEVYYRSTQYSNIDGVWIEIRGNNLKAKFSVTKQFYKKQRGRLDNSRPMTFANATHTIREMLMRLCLKEENAVVTYYEAGLTMKMDRGPEEYIKAVEKGSGRSFWNDPNFPEMRQKVTERSKYYRKILKMYDKTFEAEDKGRKDVEKNVLRIETVYKRQSVPMTDLLSEDFQKKLGRTFYADWAGIQFKRTLRAGKGVKMQEWQRAQEIYDKGVKAYLDEYRQKYLDGAITKKQWETMRSYAHNWADMKGRFVEEISQEEAEYKEKILRFYQVGSIVRCK